MLYSDAMNVPRSLCHILECASIQFASPLRYALAGNGANMKGVSSAFADVLSHSLLQVVPKCLYLKNPHWAAVEGGTILSQLSTFKSMCVDATEYEEEGPTRCTYGKIVDPR
ncbi:hypothetical protein STCU_01562 [Strigomonas culicis]|nr:hypothetical protein STCU_01562 [Strigomonas culicis]|eukprot:EPY34482.1 hypothetical protein STCU_01562 [Strigomonas culicis]